MITTHQYLDKYPIKKDSKKLIVGTIHPHFHEEFKVPFFYGNVVSLWNLLHQAFPTELNLPINVKNIMEFLDGRNIAISDTIKIAERKNPTALDKDLIPIQLNLQLLDDIRNSDISEILFTSGFGKNNAFRLFYVNMLGLRITNEIKSNREIILPEDIFGRPIRLTILYSPSGTSNVGISKSKLYLENKYKYADLKTPVQAFKIDYYREKFS